MVYHSSALDATFFALADPTRREILSRLATGDRTISELASRFDMSLPAVSKHVRVLQSAGLASVERQGRVRRAHLQTEPMRGALEWIAYYKQFWESELDQLARYLESPSQADSSQTEESWPPQPPQAPQKPSPARSASKSAAPSVHRANASSTRGRKRTK